MIIENKYIYLISAMVVLFVGIGLVIGGTFTGSAGVGHDIGEVQGYGDDISLGNTLGRFDNSIIGLKSEDIRLDGRITTLEGAGSGGAGSLSCYTETCSGTGSCTTPVCDSGYTLTGGGGRCGEAIRLSQKYPTGDKWWVTCDSSSVIGGSAVSAYAICCKII